jgi:iron complex outermembrane receptor protein
MSSLRKRFLCSSGLLLVLAAAAPASAQSASASLDAPAPSSPESADDEGNAVADIVVTAQKRSQNLQDVPISITAIDADTLQRRSVSGTLDLQSVIPGFQSSQVTSAATPALRSLGSTEPSPGNEGSVALYVDGIYYATQNSGLFSFPDIERVEVLKGPQGTLFGRNATAGLINIITRTPSQTPTGELTLGYGNFDTFRATGYFSTGLTQDVAASISGVYANQGKGWGRNLFTGRDAFKAEEVGVRGKVYVTPGPNTRITLAASYNEQRNDIGSAFLPEGAPAFTVNINLPPRVKTRDWGVSGRIEQDLGFASLVSITAYRDNVTDFAVDQDRSPLAIIDALLTNRTHAFTQEVQLVSDASSKLEWIFGGFYMSRSASVDPVSIGGLGLAPFGLANQSIFGTQTTKSISGFAQATYPILENTRVTAGLRYTSDRTTYDGEAVLTLLDPAIPPITLPDPNSGSRTDSKLTYRFVVDQKIGSTLLYASYDRGFKSGFFNMNGFPATSVKPEVLDSLQLGVKGDLFDRRLRFDAAAFFYDYSNIQIVFVQNGAAIAVNAGNARINGFEFNLTALPVRGLNLTAGVTWLPKARYGTFDPCPAVTVAGDTCNGSRTIRSPRISLALGADYTFETDIGNFTPAASFNYSSSFPWVAAANQPTVPTFSEDAYGVVNASFSWTSTLERFNASIWARNLNDARYSVYGTNDAFGNWTVAAAPRTFGGTIGVKF